MIRNENDSTNDAPNDGKDASDNDGITGHFITTRDRIIELSPFPDPVGDILRPRGWNRELTSVGYHPQESTGHGTAMDDGILDNLAQNLRRDQDNSSLSELEYQGCVNQLTTTFQDNLGSYGNMFDIYTYESLELYGIDIYTDQNSTVEYEIYTKPNTFKEDNGKENRTAWTLLIQGSAIGQGRRKPTPVRGFQALIIPFHTTMAFYVTLTTPDIRYRDIRTEMPNAQVGDVFTKNDDLEIRVGVSVGEYPMATSFFGRRAWSGTLHYVLENSCPSTAPSPAPSRTETFQPSSTQPSLPPSMLESLTPSQRESLAPSQRESLTPSEQESLSPSQKESMTPSQWPTSQESMFPTSEPTQLVAKFLGPCTEEGTINTSVEGGTGAFGSMFTVTSHNSSLKITTLSFHTDFTEGPITAQVFTKIGDFIGFENLPDAWLQIADSTLIGEGAGLRTQIPTSDFDAVNMYPHETRAFYVTLTSADIRYSRTNVTLGEPVAGNEFLSVNAGAGLADYPFANKFYLYEPREFNGAVHYNSTVECLPTNDVVYAFHVHHSPGMREVDLTRRMNNNVHKTIQGLFETDPTLLENEANHHLRLERTTTIVTGEPCQPISPTFECTPVEVNITLKHTNTTRWGDLKFIFLNFFEEVTLNVNLEFQAKYVGDLAVVQTTTFVLGSNSSLEEMTANQTTSFENAITDFLVAPLMKKGVIPLGVKVTSQANTGGGNGRRLDRRAQRSGGSINIATTITGEYRPPPDVDFDSAVNDAFDSDSKDLEKRINRADTYFEVVNSVKVATTEKAPEQVYTPIVPKARGFPIVIVAVAAGIFVLLGVLFLLWCLKRRKKRQEADQWNQQLNLTSEVLDGSGGLFGGLLSKKKKFNFGDDFAGNAVVTAWSAPVRRASLEDIYNDDTLHHDPDAYYKKSGNDHYRPQYADQKGCNDHFLPQYAEKGISNRSLTRQGEGYSDVVMPMYDDNLAFDDEYDDYDETANFSSLAQSQLVNEYTEDNFRMRPQHVTAGYEVEEPISPHERGSYEYQESAARNQRSDRRGIFPISSLANLDADLPSFSTLGQGSLYRSTDEEYE